MFVLLHVYKLVTLKICPIGVVDFALVNHIIIKYFVVDYHLTTSSMSSPTTLATIMVICTTLVPTT